MVVMTMYQVLATQQMVVKSEEEKKEEEEARSINKLPLLSALLHLSS
jgi:hypothetical protein